MGSFPFIYPTAEFYVDHRFFKKLQRIPLQILFSGLTNYVFTNIKNKRFFNICLALGNNFLCFVQTLITCISSKMIPEIVRTITVI